MDTELSHTIETFFSQYKHQRYSKGEILIRSDDDPQGVFFLKSGLVKMYTISPKGDELVLNIFKPTAFFPISWVINKTPNNFYFEAISAVEVWRAPENEVRDFITSNSDVQYDLLCRVYTGMDGLLTRMTYLMSGSAYTRLIAELLIYAKRFSAEKKMILLEVSEKDLAAQSGMTRETVSREMKVLKDKNLIAVQKNKLYITDLQKMEHELLDE